MTDTPTIWKGRTITHSGFTAGSQAFPQIIGLANDGNILTVWQDDTNGPGEGIDIVASLFTPEGLVYRNTFQINTVTNEDQTSVEAVALPDGGFVIAYGQTGGNVITVQRYDRLANLVATNFMLESNGSLLDWDIVADPAGNYTLVFERDVAHGSTIARDVQSVTHSFATNAQGPIRTNVAQNTEEVDYLGAAATFANGHLITLAMDNDDSDATTELTITDPATGTLVRPTVEIGGAEADGAYPNDVAVLAGGQFVAIYREGEDIYPFSWNHRLWMRIGASETGAIGSRIQIDATSEHTLSARVVALADGGFFVAWTIANTFLRGQRYSSIGQPIGVEMGLADDGRNLGDLSLTADGRILVAYQTTGDDIAQIILDPRDPNEAIVGTGANEAITGMITGTALFGEGGNDRLYGQGQQDIIGGGPGDDTITGGAGGDIVHGDDNNDTLYGDQDDDFLFGDAGNDFLDGGPGRDRLNGGPGEDTLAGGLGDDTYVLDNVHEVVGGSPGQRAYDTVAENGGGGDGIDTVLVQRVGTLSGYPASYTLTANVENAIIQGIATFHLIGNGLANRLTGNTAGNILDGGAGSDILEGGAGTDTLKGGGGDDQIYVDHAGDVVTELQGGGVDRVFASASYALPGGTGGFIEMLTTTNHGGTGAINLTGNDVPNIIYGNAGANILNGLGAADTLVGLGGNDWFYVDSAADVVLEGAGQGAADRVFAIVNYTLGAAAQVETLTTTNNGGTDALALTGNGFANTIYGNAGANTLNGAGGADTLLGLGGNDFFMVDNAADVVIEAANEGADQVLASVDYTLGAGRHIETLSTNLTSGLAPLNLKGNEFNNTVVGNAGSNAIKGMAGNDPLYGGGGSDAFVFNTALNAATNVDTVLDFTPVDDYVMLSSGIFTVLAAGVLPATAFAIGAAATEADDRIIYNSASGAVLYDSDGSGAAAAIRFATLSGTPAITNADFIVV